MLDLDSLAERCAKSLNEKQEMWLNAVWSADFQKVSQNMSDGEVEILLNNCKSVLIFETVLRYLLAHPDQGKTSPYTILVQGAGAAGVVLADWIATLPDVAGTRP